MAESMKGGGPIELRLFHKQFTIEDALLGMNYIRFPQIPDKVFCPAVSQYRYKMRVQDKGQVEMVWSDWITIPVVLEGVEPPKQQPTAALDGSAA